MENVLLLRTTKTRSPALLLLNDVAHLVVSSHANVFVVYGRPGDLHEVCRARPTATSSPSAASGVVSKLSKGTEGSKSDEANVLLLSLLLLLLLLQLLLLLELLQLLLLQLLLLQLLLLL